LYIKNTDILSGVRKLNEPLYNFLLNKWYFDELYEAIFVKPLKLIGSFLWNKSDQNTIDRYGPDGFSKIIKYFSNKAVKFQSGYIYDYAFVMLLGLSFLLTYLIIK
jgi:NADH-quinone oxidoreductase subunit L